MLPRLASQRVLAVCLLLCTILLLTRIAFFTPETNADRIRSVSHGNQPFVHPKSLNELEKAASMEQKLDVTICEFDPECKSPELVVKLGTETHHSSPFGCLNDIKIFEAKDLKKGLNVVVLSEELMVEKLMTFDVEKTDEKLISWLQDFREHRAILVVSLGDVAEHISPDARKLLSLFGAKKIHDWRHGDAYALLGQWGLVEGNALEMTSPLSEEISPASMLNDCYGFPLGDLRNVSYLQNGGVVRVDESILADFLEPVRSDVRLGEFWENCGRDQPCGSEEMPMHFYSGQNKDDTPKMCVAEKYVFSKDLNAGGRGLNVAVIDPKSRAVVRVGHFDTYEQESSGLERFLDLVEPGQIVAAVSFDEASTMLSEMAKRILYELGSSMIDRIKFRAAWYFVGQKGINAYTPFEDLNYPTGNNWATPIKTWICVPISLSGHKDSMMRVVRQNIPKRHFCAKYDGHDGFCNDKVVDTPITPRPLLKTERHTDPIFNVPIIIATGIDFNSLRVTLESVMAQPGINTQMLLVAHNSQYKEAADLATLFHAKPLSLNASSDYNEIVRMSVEAAFALFPKATEVIVIEEDTVLTNDFLSSVSQLLPIFRADQKIAIIQGFNYNGFLRLSHDPHLIYRVENHSPAYAYLMKRDAYTRGIRWNPDCCHRLHHWSMKDWEALVFDLSRSSITNPDSNVGATDLPVKKAERRASDSEYELDLKPISTQENYQASIFERMRNSTVFGANQTSLWSSCKEGGFSTLIDNLFAGMDQSDFVIEYTTNEELGHLLDCFNAVHFPDFVPGKFRKFTRFFIDDIHVILRRV
ncbi:unnamed protein product, partial [Mesorhabditis belari]|uniref:ILEI/PANDER domain-containing protein n=1 Tax=Mesorhabditis belari TaxID=2138241 RepID=A0AAF3J9X7_9BILA